MTHFRRYTVITQGKSYFLWEKPEKNDIFIFIYIPIIHAIAILVNTVKVIVIPKQSKLQYQPAFYRL